MYKIIVNYRDRQSKEIKSLTLTEARETIIELCKDTNVIGVPFITHKTQTDVDLENREYI